MVGKSKGAFAGNFAVEVGHHLFGLEFMQLGVHVSFLISGRRGSRKALRAVRARKRRERTVLTGKRRSAAISSYVSCSYSRRSRMSRCSASSCSIARRTQMAASTQESVVGSIEPAADDSRRADL